MMVFSMRVNVKIHKQLSFIQMHSIHNLCRVYCKMLIKVLLLMVAELSDSWAIFEGIFSIFKILNLFFWNFKFSFLSMAKNWVNNAVYHITHPVVMGRSSLSNFGHGRDSNSSWSVGVHDQDIFKLAIDQYLSLIDQMAKIGTKLNCFHIFYFILNSIISELIEQLITCFDARIQYLESWATIELIKRKKLNEALKIVASNIS